MNMQRVKNLTLVELSIQKRRERERERERVEAREEIRENNQKRIRKYTVGG